MLYYYHTILTVNSAEGEKPQSRKGRCMGGGGSMQDTVNWLPGFGALLE